MEIETAARRRYLQDPTVQGYVTGKVFKHSLLERVDGTGGRALVVRRSNGWAQADNTQSSEYPILVVDCWADRTRSPEGDPLGDDAIDKAYALWRAVDSITHRVRDQWWGGGGSDLGLMMVSIVRWVEPFHMTSDDQHGAGSVATKQPMGECALVSASYAVHCAQTVNA